MIAIISGSIREDSNARRVGHYLECVYKGLGAETAFLDLGDLPPEAYLGTAYKDRPDAVQGGFIDPVLRASGLVVIVPEYNGSYPGVLKHFIDLLPFPESFDGRPVAFVGLAAGYYGGLRAVEQLQMVFAYRNGVLFNRRVFIPNIYAVIGDTGELKDPEIQERLDLHAQSFLEFIGKVARSG